MDPFKDLSSETSPQYEVHTFLLLVEYEDGTLKLFSNPCNINLKTNHQILFNSPFSLSHNTNSHSITGSAPYLIFSEDSTCISSDIHSIQNLLLESEGQPARIRQFP